MTDSTPEPQHAAWFEHLRVTALTATMLALVITIFIEPLGIGSELNPFAVAAVASLGWTKVGVAAILAVAAIFALYRRYLPHYPKLTLTAAGSVTALSLADLLANIAVLLYAGVPTAIWWGKYAPRALAVVATTALVLTAPLAAQRFRPHMTRLQTRVPSLPVHGRQLAAIMFGVLLTVSIIGPGVIMLPGVDSDHDGLAAADHDWTSQDQYQINGDQPLGLEQTSDGHFFVVNTDTDAVDEYDENFNFITSHSTSATAPQDIEHNGTHFFVTDTDNGEVEIYNDSFTFVGTESLRGNVTLGIHLAENGDWYVATNDNREDVNHYDNDFNFIESFDISANVDVPAGLERSSDGQWQILDRNANSVYKYSESFGYVEESLNSSTKNLNGLEKGNDGNYFLTDYDSGSQDYVHEYGGHPVSDAVSGDVTGQVLDQNGDPVANATVVALYNDTNPPDFDTSNLQTVANDPTAAMDGWDEYLDEFNVDALDEIGRAKWNSELSDTSDPRVVPYRGDKWNVETHQVDIPSIFIVDGQWYQTREVEVQDVQASNPDLQFDNEEEVVLTCWEGDSTGFTDQAGNDYIDRSLPGETTPCKMTVEKVDELGNAEWSETKESHTLAENRAPQHFGLGNLGGVKEHHGIVMQPQEGVYRASPEDSNTWTYFVVAPDGNLEKLTARLENWASNRIDETTARAKEWNQSWANGKTERTVTNSSGYYALQPPTGADTVDVTAFKAGTEISYDPKDQTRQDIENEIETSIRGNFRAETGVDFDEAADAYDAGTDDTFESVCERMDSVANDVGEPYHGTERGITVPTNDADIKGYRFLTDGVGPDESVCAAMNFAQQIAEDGFGSLVPGFQGDLSNLSDAELEQRYRQLMTYIEGTPGLESELDERTDGDIDTILNDNPEDLPRDKLESRISEGIGAVDSDGDTNYGGGNNGGAAGGGSDAPTVGTPDASTGNETLSSLWNVGNVDDWDADGTSLLVRIHYSNGSTVLLNRSSDYVSVEESTFGTDTVQLTEYPLGETDPATVQVELDVSTPGGSAGDPDTGQGVVRNPTFEGDIPALRDVKVSKFAPGPSDNVTISVTPRQDARFGELKYANVSHPDCSYGKAAEDGELDVWTCGEGAHHVKVTFTNSGGVEFVETLNLEALPATQSRPASIRSKVSPLGRHAIVNGQLRGGDIQTQDGGSLVEIIAIAEPGDIPNSVTASMTKMDVATDSDITVRVVEGGAQQTVRKRIGVVLHRDTPEEGALLYRNGNAIPRTGETANAKVSTESGHLTVDSFTNEEAEMTVRVNGEPSILDRVRHYISLNVPFPSLSVGGDLLLFLTPLVIVGRRRRKRPPNTGSNGGGAAA